MLHGATKLPRRGMPSLWEPFSRHGGFTQRHRVNWLAGLLRVPGTRSSAGLALVAAVVTGLARVGGGGGRR